MPCVSKCMDGYLAQHVAIRSHNDELRTRLRGGAVSLSDDVQELGPIIVAHALVAMTESTEFDDEEHQSGRFLFCARMFRWSISYSDSRNPANAKITRRELLLSLLVPRPAATCPDRTR
jgi:hypothetical protein